MKKREVIYRGNKYKVLSENKVKYGNEIVTMLILDNKSYKLTVNSKYVVNC